MTARLLSWSCRFGPAVPALLAAATAGAQAPVVVSPKPEGVSVTVYRAPDRDADEPIDRDDPEGYALITETRTIDLPAGSATIRFEEVAGGILPESAIVAGLPGDVAEKNLDADLLSPRTLYDRALGRRVVVRRTDPATGRVHEEQAVIRSSADGAAVLQLAGGHEALRCSGLPETIVYSELPPGLSPRPTLSIGTQSRRATRATVTLSYLAGGFDWQADYVVTLHPNGRADLFAWVTLASADVTGFPDARTQVVAGAPKREETEAFAPSSGGALRLRCWPTTINYGHTPPPPPPPPPPPMMMAAPMARMAEDIIVTGSRVRQAVQEELGDLKLYRLPDRTTVAARAQKQVALLARDGVPMETVYASSVDGDDVDAVVPTLRARNRADAGLGLPLPAGRVAVLHEGAARPLLIGETSLGDTAVGERVELRLSPSPQVTATVETLSRGRTGEPRRYRLTVTNANSRPIRYEARLAPNVRTIAATTRREGQQVWTAAVPANGTRTLDYRTAEQ